MITPAECCQLSRETVRDFINHCGCRDTDDIRRVLINLIGMASHAMIATNGLDAALQALTNTHEHLQKTKPEYTLREVDEGIEVKPLRKTQH